MKKKIFLLSFLIWLLPFCIRLLLNISYENISPTDIAKEKTVTSLIFDAVESHRNYEAFIIVFENNIKSCAINICGGVLLGVSTVFNLAINGFTTADVFVGSYASGFSVANIVKTTLPHSFELIGFWLSGAIGLIIAWQFLQFMREREDFTVTFIKQIGVLSFAVFVIILFAAYVETYISVNML